MRWMRSAAQVLFIIVLAGKLATNALACPAWMGLMSGGDMPCAQSAPDKCPASICLLSSPYLASPVRTHVPLLQELGSPVVDSPLLLTSLQFLEPTLEDNGGTPGPSSPLFLRTHSLLI